MAAESEGHAISSSSRRLERVLWDSDGPYIVVKDGVRLTALRAGDVDAYVSHYEPQHCIFTALGLEECERDCKLTVCVACSLE